VPKGQPVAKPESETPQADVSLETEEITKDRVTTPLKEAEEKGEYAPLAPEIDEATHKRAKEILETLLEKMSVKGEVQVRMGHNLVELGETPPLTLDVTGPDLGVLIGKRGETLRALQFVVRQILSKEAGHWIPVVVDVESYLVRRRKSLKQLANRMADRVAFSKRKVVLEPMSAQERRIIHLQLREHEQVYTQSIGDGERRKVVIYPK
jgi:spoIIIJ-associated protein